MWVPNRRRSSQRGELSMDSIRTTRGARNFMRAALTVSCCVLALSVGSARAADSGKAVSFNIAATDLAGALNEFAQQSDQQIVFGTEATEGKHAPALHGTYKPTEALDTLLRGSGLTYK